jgi:hypothetical protein
MKVTLTLDINPSDVHCIHDKTVLIMLDLWLLKHLFGLLFLGR